jgi:predicted RNA binding protein YcfA (HicA-like mRNA interferase family)
MPKLSPIRGVDLITILKKQGFFIVRQKGSHARLEHADGRKTTVPVHRGERVGKGLLRKILHDINLTPDEFNEMR